MRNFYLKCFAIALPFLFLGTWYTVADPFMVLRPYSDYDHSDVCQNEGTVGWLKYKQQRHSQHYDSFILGTSTTKAFQSTDWLQYVHGHTFRLFSNSESIGNIAAKLEALSRQPNQPIRNLLIILEPNSMQDAIPKNSAMHIMPPDVSGKSWKNFQTVFFQSFCTPDFLGPYLQFQLTKRYTNNMSGVINDGALGRDKLTNDAIIGTEEKIKTMGEDYWAKGEGASFAHKKYKLHYAPRYLFAQQRACLERINDICKRHHTNLRVIVGIRLDRLMTNPADIQTLHEVFGADCAFVFATPKYDHWNNYHNYYDPAHYTIGTARKMLAIAYRK